VTQLQVDIDLCQGHGRCYRLAPSVFRPTDGDGHAEVIPTANLSEEATATQAERALNACPEMAITQSSDD
jgi:ferredoxin